MKTVIAWLLESDPSIRWQVLRDLLQERDDVVARERLRVGTEGWGARLLAFQGSDGHWGGAAFVGGHWTSTFETLYLSRELGLDPASDEARAAIDRVREHCTWGPEFGDSPFFEGEVEPCINGRTLAIGSYFGEASDRLVDRLLSEQLNDGGWNCEVSSARSSFHSTICVLEGLLEYENAKGPIAAVGDARRRAHEYLLERRMFRSLRTGEVIDPHWTRFTFPTRWHYDVLWGLDYLRRARVRDERAAEAIALVRARQDVDGRWPLENVHAGKDHFEMEAPDAPSRWNTLRAMRVLAWFGNR